MNTSSATRLWQEKTWIRIAFRGVLVLLFSKFAVEAAIAYQHTKAANYLFLLISESITVGLVVFARDSQNVSLRLPAVISAICATFYYLAFDFFSVSSFELIPKQWGIFIQCISIILQIAAKLSLGRSFGVIPANRGLAQGGAYRIVRHPIYASYVLAHIGFILSVFSFWNFAILVILYIFQIVRIFEEERLLRNDPKYVEYMRRVKWRLIPGVF